MYKISLINMPFSELGIPSIALTQLKTVLDERFGDQVRVRILYLNFDFSQYLGHRFYAQLAAEFITGMSEWLFRQVAFPQEPDNIQEYFRRYSLSEQEASLKGRLLAKRAGLDRFLRHLIEKYGLGEESLVGFTSMFAQNLPSLAMARLLKEISPSTVMAMGGANCEAPMGPELARQVEQLDYVFSGPSLISFPEVVQALMDGDSKKAEQVPGVFTKGNQTPDRLKGPGQVGKELPIDVAVPLDYDSFLQGFEQTFQGRIKPNLLFETSRGCWWGERAHCTFCGLNGNSMGYRAMPPKAALQLIEGLLDRYSDRCRHYESVDNILPKEYLKEVFPFLKTPRGVSFFYEVKADLSEQEMEVLSKAGVTQIQPGIEALSTSTLKLMKKGTTAIRNVIFLKNAIQYEIRPSWNLLIGFPGESRETFEKYSQDLPLLHHLPPPTNVFSVRFDRFSPYHVRAKEYGLDLSPYDFYRYLYPFGEDSLTNLAYYFEDRNYSAQYLADMVAWKNKLGRLVQDWKDRWCGEDGNPKGQLCLDGLTGSGSRIVCDWRSGTLEEFEPSPTGLRILELLDNRGYRTADIARHLGLEEQQAVDELARLRERRLLFEENDRYVSLVMANKQSPDMLARRPPAWRIGFHRDD